MSPLSITPPPVSSNHAGAMPALIAGAGIMDYLTNGGRIEVAQRMAGHSNAKTTGLYDRRNDEIIVGEVERIGI
jgi:hypothetical protein